MAQDMNSLGRSIGASYNQCFNWTSSNMFYALSPAYLKRYYNLLVRTCDWWISGWVQGFHNERNLIFPTQFAASLCGKLTDLIYGGGFTFTGGDEVKNDASEFLTGRFEQEANLSGNIYQAIKCAVELGNGLLKLNCSNNDIWIDTVAGNRFFVDTDARGRVVASRSYIGFYTAGIANAKKTPDTYALSEERYYKEVMTLGFLGEPKVEKKPFVRYVMYRVSYPTADVQNVSRGLNYKELPRSIQIQFREEYGNVMLNEERQLELSSIGVYNIKYTENITSMPNIKLGEPAILKIINYLPQYDLVTSEKNIVDPRVSRPKVNIPAHMNSSQGKRGDQLAALDDITYTLVPTLSDKDQTITSNFMPTMRTKDLISLRTDIIKQVCGQIGVEASSIYSDLYEGSAQKTATQVSIEQSNTALYIINKRKIFIGTLNRMIHDILLFYGIKDNVTLEFTEPGTTNTVIMTDTITKQKAAGLISDYAALKALNPTTPEDNIVQELEEISKANGTVSSRDNA